MGSRESMLVGLLFGFTWWGRVGSGLGTWAEGSWFDSSVNNNSS